MDQSNDPVMVDGKRSRGRRLRARHVLVGAVAVLVTGVATVVLTPTDRPLHLVASDDATASTSGAPEVIGQETPTTALSATTTAPSTTSTTEAGSSAKTPTTTTPAAGPTVATEALPADPDQIYLPAGGVMFRYEAGRSVWEATSNGFTIRVRVDPPAPRGGQVVRFSINVSGKGACCDAVVGYDGHMLSQLGRDGSTCPSVPGNSFETSFVYNTAGLVRFKVRADECNDAGFGWLSGWLQVAEGQSSVQGPALPTVNLATYGPTEHQGDFRYLPLHIDAQDKDGWIRQLTVDWGDGTASETFPGDSLACRAVAPWGWPVGHRVSHPKSTPGATSPMHFYPAPGTYSVTVTTRSTACDGSEPQEGTATMLWTVP